jgi:glutaconate CoA-transferase subunit A
MEGFTHLIRSPPVTSWCDRAARSYARAHDARLIYDQLIGMGCARKLVFSWGGNPGVGSLHRLRDAVEQGWPHALEIEERSHADIANAYVAGAANLPFSMMRGYTGSDLPKHNRNIRFIECPFTGEKLAATPAIRTDVTFIHAQKADRRGNVYLWGISHRRRPRSPRSASCHGRGRSWTS